MPDSDQRPADSRRRDRVRDQLARARLLAGVDDPWWTPLLAPEDVRPGRELMASNPTDWPAWVTSPAHFPIFSVWRLSKAARIVAAAHCAYPTLALVDDLDPTDRYQVAAGTSLTLVETYDPDHDDRVCDLDLSSYYMFAEGWASRTYRIDGGRSAGIRLRFSADPEGSRFPLSSRVAHAAIVPAGATETEVS